jgi:hypothetical protein
MQRSLQSGRSWIGKQLDKFRNKSSRPGHPTPAPRALDSDFCSGTGDLELDTPTFGECLTGETDMQEVLQNDDFPQSLTVQAGDIVIQSRSPSTSTVPLPDERIGEKPLFFLVIAGLKLVMTEDQGSPAVSNSPSCKIEKAGNIFTGVNYGELSLLVLVMYGS